MRIKDDRTLSLYHRAGDDPDAVVARLVDRVPEQDGTYPYLATAASLLSVAAGWAYADEAAFGDVVARAGLSNAGYRLISVENDAMFVDAAAYLVRSRCGRLAILCFRGTLPRNVIDWFADASVAPLPFRELGNVHGGFYRNVIAVWPAIWEKMTEFLADGRLEALYISGHSLGGAMAALAGMTLRYDEEYAAARPLLRGVYTFGQPMVAEPGLATECERDLGTIVFRHVYEHDLVPRLPPLSAGRFKHFGREYGARPSGLGWEERSTAVSQALSALVSLPIGAGAWVLRQLALTRWLNLPFSWDDHSPVHYVRVSQNAPGVPMPSMKHVRYSAPAGPVAGATRPGPPEPTVNGDRLQAPEPNGGSPL